MKIFGWIIISFFHICTFTEEWYLQNNAIILTSDTIFGAIKEPRTIKIIKFFAPWCRYCRILKKYIDTYKEMEEIDENLRIYDVNCEDQVHDFCDQFHVGSYPTVLVFDDNGELLYRMTGMYPQEVIWEMIGTYNKMVIDLNRKNLSGAKTEENNEENMKIKQTATEKVQERKVQKSQQKFEKKVEKSQQKRVDQQVKPNLFSSEENSLNSQTVASDDIYWLKMLTMMLTFSIVGFYYQKYMSDKSVVEADDVVKEKQFKYVLRMEESEKIEDKGEDVMEKE